MDITLLLEAVITLAVTALMVVGVPWIRSHTTAEQRAELAAWVRIGVEAAEQMYKGSGRGEEKKQYVIDWLAERGITADFDKLNAMIEAAVLELNRAVSA